MDKAGKQGQTVLTKEPLRPETTKAQIQRLILERESVGGLNAKVVREKEGRFLYVEWPPPA